MDRVIHILFCLLISLQSEGYSLGLQEIRGIVLDASTGVSLSGARVSDESEKIVRATDSSGLFLVDSVVYPFSFSVKLTGYDAQTVVLDAPVDSVLRIALQPRVFTLHEVVVTSTRLSQSPFSSPSSIRVIQHSEPQRAHVESTASADSIATHFDEIVVTATRNDARLAIAPSSVSVVSRNNIEVEAGSTVAAALEGVPGVFLRSYGGNGALHSVSLRGLGAEHTLVLVDGQRYTNFQNGQVDVSILSSSNIERIEIAKGGYSSLYGADALGGVINIVTKKPEEGIHGRLASSIGSNGFNAYELTLNGRGDSLGFRAFVRNEHGSGHYDFDFHDGKNTVRLKRSGADFRLLSTGGSMDVTPSDEVETSLSLTYDQAHRGSPGAVTDLQSAGSARLNDETARLQANARWKPSAVMTWSLNSSFYYSHETYSDPQLLINNIPLRSFYTNRAWFLTPEFDFVVSPSFLGTIGMELVRASITSNEVRGIVRRQHSGFVSMQYVIPFPESNPFELLLYPSIRFDDFSDVGSDVSPKLGLNIGMGKEPVIRLRASVGKSFRAPTFNDLYWRDGGNPNLKPERSFSTDGGIIASLGSFSFEANYFSTSTRDRIVWIPGTGGIWSPKNISKVNSKGWETEVRWNGFDNALALTLNSTWTATRKESEDYAGDPTGGKLLIYVPLQMVNAGALLKADPFTFFVQHSWVSYRYATELNDRFLPHYGVTSAAVTFTQALGVLKSSVKLEATNLFNTSYQVIALYPMPLRALRATLGVVL